MTSRDLDRIRAMAAAQRGMGRRSFLRGASLTALAIGAPGLLAACGTQGQSQSTEKCVSTDISDKEKALFFSNWPEYIDVDDDGNMPTLREFQKQTGIKVTYNTDINDNDEFFAKVQAQLGDCQPIGRDVVTLTDWMAQKMIALGWLQKLDHANLPNVEANLLDNLKSPSWDKERDYSVPWQSGFTGIAYNKKYLPGGVKSFEDLVTNAKYKGKVTLLTEMRDTMGFFLKIVGKDPDDFGDEDWGTALEKLDAVVASGQIRRFTGNDYLDDLSAGNVIACEAWSGDIAASEDENLVFVPPEEGLALWSDNMLVPNKADHKANAEALMNYYYDPTVAATLAAWVWYVCPVKGAKEAMAKVDKSLVDNPLIFPTEEFLADTWGFQGLSESKATKYGTDFSKAIGA
jgi:spermidine/putrescine transport system substrate-binding protein